MLAAISARVGASNIARSGASTPKTALYARHYLCRQQRMPPQFKEIIVWADYAIAIEHRAPDASD